MSQTLIVKSSARAALEKRGGNSRFIFQKRIFLSLPGNMRFSIRPPLDLAHGTDRVDRGVDGGRKMLQGVPDLDSLVPPSSGEPAANLKGRFQISIQES